MALFRWFALLMLANTLVGCHTRKQALPETVAAAMQRNVPPRGPWGTPRPPENPDIDHVPVAAPVMPDPRLPLANAPQWPLNLDSAIAVAIGNSEVVRSITGATTAIAGSPIGGAGVTPRSLPTASGGTTPGGPGTGGGGAGGGGALATAGSTNPVGGSSSNLYSTIYDPGIAAADVESAMGAFDASLSASMFWERLENPPGQTFGGFINTIPGIDTAYWRSTVAKPLLSGGVASVSLNDNYYFVLPPNVPPSLNPQYQTHLEMALIQPLLRGAGTQVNQVPILIASTQASQSAWEFKRRMMAMIRDVETAYWQLYAAQANLRVIEESLPMYAEVVRIEESRLNNKVAVPADVAQAQTDFLELKGQRLAAQADVAQKQALLRNLLGLTPSDGRQVVLTDRPVSAPVVVDWDDTINVALQRRPDIIRQRLAVHVREMQILVAKNNLLPQLNAEGMYRIDGLGKDLSDSIDMLADNQYQDWRMGMSFSVPIGNHISRGQMRGAQLQLMREQALLKQAAHIASHQLADIVRNLDWVYQQYQVAETRRVANNEWTRGSRARFLTPAGDVSLLQALDIYLRSIRAHVVSTKNAADLHAQYNIGLAQLEEAKGTLLANHNVHIYNDPCNSVQRTLLRGGMPREMYDYVVPSPVPESTAPENREAVPAPQPPVESEPLPKLPSAEQKGSTKPLGLQGPLATGPAKSQAPAVAPSAAAPLTSLPSDSAKLPVAQLRPATAAAVAAPTMSTAAPAALAGRQVAKPELPSARAELPGPMRLFTPATPTPTPATQPAVTVKSDASSRRVQVAGPDGDTSPLPPVIKIRQPLATAADRSPIRVESPTTDDERDPISVTMRIPPVSAASSQSETKIRMNQQTYEGGQAVEFRLRDPSGSLQPTPAARLRVSAN